MKKSDFAVILLLAAVVGTGHAATSLCLGTCTTDSGGAKECSFTVKVDLHAGELGER